MFKDLLQLNTIQKRAVFLLLTLCVVLVSAYGVLMGKTVLQVMAQRDMERSMTETMTDIALLEAQYMEKVDSLTLARAYDMGFIDTDVSLFVSRRADAFSFRTVND